MSETRAVQPRTATCLALTTALLMFAAFQTWGTIAAFFCLVPLILAVRHQQRKSAFMLGWLAGAIGHGLIGFGFSETLFSYFGVGKLAVFSLKLPLCLSVGLPLAVFATLCNRLPARPKIWQVATIALAYAVLDTTITRYWMPSQVTQLVGCLWRWPIWLQTADIFGVTGPTFLMGLASLTCAMMLETLRDPGAERNMAGMSAGLVLVLASAFCYANWQENRLKSHTGDTPIRLCCSENPIAEVPANKEVELIVLPESSVDLARREEADRWLEQVRANPRASILCGILRHAFREGVATRLNSACLSSNGRVQWYDKRNLVPFCESFPLGNFDPFGCRRAGWQPMTSGAPDQPLFTINQHPLALLICYEMLDPSLVAFDVRRGGSAIIALSNEEAFAANTLTERSVSSAVLRAIENRRPVVKVDKAGQSIVISPTGRHLTKTAGSAGWRTVSVNPMDGLTVYTRTEQLQTNVYRGLTAILLAWLILPAIKNWRNGEHP